MTVIFCSWVDAEVDDSLLMNGCHGNIKNGRCELCQRSEQLNYGVTSLEILKRATEE